MLCISEHLCSCRFGTFLYNNDRERAEQGDLDVHARRLKQRALLDMQYTSFARQLMSVSAAEVVGANTGAAYVVGAA